MGVGGLYPGHPDHKVMGGRGALSQRNFFRPFGPKFGLKIRGTWAPPLDLPLNLPTANDACTAKYIKRQKETSRDKFASVDF